MAVITHTNDDEIKEAFQYNPRLEALAWDWIEELLGEKIGDRSSRLVSHLKSGKNRFHDYSHVNKA